MVRQRVVPTTILQDLTKLIQWIIAAAIVSGIGYVMFFREPSPTLVQLETQQAASGLWFYSKWTLIGLVLIAFASGVVWLVFVVVANIRNRMLASKIVNGKIIDNYNTRDEYGHRHQFTTVIDTDKMVNPTIRMDRNGTVGIDEFGSADIQTQASISRQVNAERTRKQIEAEQAKTAFLGGGKGGGTATRTKAPTRAQLQAQAGVFDAQAETERQKQLLIASRQAKQKQLPAPAEDVPVEWEFIAIRDAFNQSSRENLCVAQDQKNGSLFFWNQAKNGAHIRIHGESGSGKTQLALGFVGQMIMEGWKVIILDRRKFKNYKCVEGMAQFIDTRNPQVLLDSLSEIERIHERRDIALGKVGADDISDLENPPYRICVVIEEFLATMRAAKREDIDKDILMTLESLTAETRSSGIHFMFIDQKPVGSVWGDVMRANVGAAFMGYMPKGQGRTTTGADMGEELQNFTFYFERSNQFVKGWDAKSLLSAKAAQLPALRSNIIDVSATVQVIEQQKKMEQRKAEIAVDDELTPKRKAAINFMLGNPDMTISKAAASAEVSESYIKFANKYIRANSLTADDYLS